MPVDFLTDEQAAAFGRFAGCPPQAELERVFLLDDADWELVGARRGAHNKLGFALQLTTVRYLGTFLADPLEVPSAVVDFLAAQLDIVDASCVKSYTERTKTPYEHQWEIRRVCGYRDFTEAVDQVDEFLAARAWTRVETAKALFEAAVAWLRQHRVLLPGVSVLTRLVIEHRRRAAQQLHTTVAQAATATDPELPSRLKRCCSFHFVHTGTPRARLRRRAERPGRPIPRSVPQHPFTAPITAPEWCRSCWCATRSVSTRCSRPVQQRRSPRGVVSPRTTGNVRPRSAARPVRGGRRCRAAGL